MAALEEGQQYGLSANDKINNYKTLVFVKLTDSALRSIEEYVKSRGDTSSKPTIQFQTNNGIISLPKTTNKSYSNSNQTYGFTLSNVEADGPQGSFECLQETGPEKGTKQRSLESFGCMLKKMHIHANEDSYEKTRVKMAAVEQENKKFCTKEIKPAGGHIGRKVKLKRPVLPHSPVKASSPTWGVAHPKPATKHLSSISATVGGSTLAPPPSRKVQPPSQKYVNTPTPRSKHANSPELLRQTVRDRLIHLLAVRTYKKPELMKKLYEGGMKEKDKNSIGVILSQVAVLKGGCTYSLANNLWNEVQDSWKFCTQDEAETIRKNKRHYLSTNSENEVPPPNNVHSNSSQKRIVGELPINQDHRNKKQRISHYSKPEPNSSSTTTTVPTYPLRSETPSEFRNPSEILQPTSNGTTRKEKPTIGHFQLQPTTTNNTQPTTDYSCQKSPVESLNANVFPSLSQKNHGNPGPPTFPSSEHLNQRSCTREDNEKNIRNHMSALHHQQQDKKLLSVPPAKGNPTMPISARYVNPAQYQKSFEPEKPGPLCAELLYDANLHVSPDSNTHYQGNELKSNSSAKSHGNGYVNNSGVKSSHGSSRSFMKRAKVTSTTNGSCSTSPHSSSDSRDSMDYSSSGLQVPPPESSPTEFDCPDYDKEYVVIKTGDQRARYKADFNAQYEEYLQLHSKIKSISKKFASLEDQLHTCEQGSEDFKKIKGKIYKEYRAYQQDPNYIDALKKFNFLHHKLSHIKRLVMEYDNAQCGRS